jgi:hypothetical protein
MSDLKSVLINDSRIEDISGEIGFAVESGASQNTYQQYSANTYSNSSHTWQILLPSENIVMDRRVLIDTDVTFVINIKNVTAGSIAFDWGNTDGFGPYPLNSCYNTQNALINNNSLSVNTQDIIAPLLRMNDQQIHTHYDGFTPSMVDDVYYNYSDAVNTNNNPLSAMDNASFSNKIRGRGAHTITSMTIAHYLSTAPTVIADASVISTNVNDTWAITITTHLTEPLLFLSPFISNPCVSNQAGFLGVNNMTFNFVVDATLKRVFRTSNPWTYSVNFGGTTGSAFSKLRLLVNYLSVQPSQFAKISARNILPLLQYNRYIPNGSNLSPLVYGTSQVITSANIALNQVPDTILFFVRVPMGSQTARNSDSFATITGISVNFNNVSGILASATPYELWILSQRAGSTQSWAEFSGSTNKKNISGGIGSVPTTGSILMLQPAYSFNLPDYLSASSLGSYNLQFNLTVTNQAPLSYVGDNTAGVNVPVNSYTPEVVVITITSGYMVTHNGTSSSYSGVLNKSMVLECKEGASVPRLSQSDYERLVGGVRDNRGVMNMMKHFKARRHHMRHPEAPIGGVMSGGDSSNRLSKYIR